MPRRVLVLFLLAAALVVAWRLVTVFSFADQGVFEKYPTLADRTLRGELAGRLTDVSPLYLWLITLARMLGLSIAGVRVIQIAATGAAALLCALVARRFGGTLAAAVAMLAVLGSRAVFLNATELEPETLILLLNALALFFLIDREPSAMRVFTGGIFLGASIAARPTALLAALILLAFLPRRRMAAYAAGVVVPVLTVLAITFALTGHATVMNPGTVFYEGMNPRAEGYEGVRPMIVNDVGESVPNEPDRLHVAFRIIAARALGRPIAPEEANRYWTGKAFAFARAEPGQVLSLTARKLFFALHSHDAWDLPSMIQRTAELSKVWIPFGLVVALALFASFATNDRRPALALILVALSYVAVMAAFYVTARQRNAMIPATAILAGIGVAAIASWPRTKVLFATLVVLIVTALLTRDYPWQRENRYNWIAYGRSLSLINGATRAERAGDARAAVLQRAHDATWLFGDDPELLHAPPALIAGLARERLARTDSDERRFDLALALQAAGAWPDSDRVLAGLQQRGYVPMRGFSAVRSVAYYRAVARLRAPGRSEAAAQLRRALAEAPANEEVLALAALFLGDAQARARLFAVHDPFTARAALARALRHLGREEDAARELVAVARGIPEWPRPPLLIRP